MEGRSTTTTHMEELRTPSPGILLVSMPWAPMIQPSLSLGLLQAVLRRAGRSCSTVYANLAFTSAIGEEAYRMLIRTLSSDGLREWTFSAAAFPDFHPDDEGFLRLVHGRSTLPLDFDAFAGTARTVRSAATAFVQELAGRLAAGRPRIVGCTTSMNQHAASLALLRELRALAPDAVTLLGGANCLGTMGRATHETFPWIDFVVSGDADGLIVPLTERIEAFGRDIPPELLPPGVLGPVHRIVGYPSPSRGVFDGIEDLPLPDFGDFFDTLAACPHWLRDMILPSLPVETSRGCWWGDAGGCRFCGIDHSGRRFVSKSATRVLWEFDALEERYHTGRIQTADNVMDPGYFTSLLPQLAREPRPYRIFFEIRPTSDGEDVRRLAAAGIRWIWAGIESLHSGILDLAGKGLSTWENLQFLKACRRHGIFTGWNLMCDFPGEEDAWYTAMAEIVPLCMHLQPPAACTRVRLDRFSHYHRDPGKYGLELHPAGPAEHVYPMTPGQLERQVYFFEDPARRADPRFDALLDRPGVRSVHDAVNSWRERFFSGNPPRLEASEHGDVCTITDSRADPAGTVIEIRGFERVILRACDRAPAVEDLRKEAARPDGEVVRALEELVDLGLVILIDGRAVGLPLRDPAAALPQVWEYPGGGLVSPTMRYKIERQSDPRGNKT
jgi:ribosomal peptide maturation radical SAM protein 1